MPTRRALPLAVAVLLLFGPGTAALAQGVRAQATAPSPSVTTSTKPPGSGPSDDFSQPPDANLPSDPSARDQEIEHRIAEANARQADLLAEIDQSDQKRRQLDLVVTDLDRQVNVLNSQLSVVHRDLDRVTATYLGVESQLEDSAQRLTDSRVRVQRRAAEVYKEGPGGFVNFVLGARDLEDATTRVGYVRSVMRTDRATLDTLVVAQRDYQERSDQLDGLKTQKLERYNEVDAVQQKIAGALARQQYARDQVVDEIAYKKAIIARIETDRSAWEAMTARQAQDSVGIAELLAKYQGGQNVPPGVIAGFFSVPVIGEVTSQFGWRVHPIFGTRLFHSGIDIAVDEGTPIQAPADGVVVYAGWMGGYGNATVIDHGQRLATLYGHQSRLGVSVGQSVHRGDVIGYVGSTGYSTGPHLHFEVRVNGDPVDPLPWLREP
jgi:murein DD-endopeptidase MepM/ murein hydrolase activator NlpD